jgi:hypothetical protein
LKSDKRKDLYETVTMTAYVRRSPLRGLNIEDIKADRMQPPTPPKRQQGGLLPGPGLQQLFDGDIKSSKNGKDKRSRGREDEFHDDSSIDSALDSDPESNSSSSSSDSLGASIGSKSRGHLNNSHNGEVFWSHRRHGESYKP